MKIDGLIEPVKAKLQRSPPVVMVKNEVQRVFARMQRIHLLMARLGLRLMECIRLRIQDLDFERNKLYVRSGKGWKDRVAVLPKLMGHADVKTTEIYTQVMNKDIEVVISPLDML